MRMFRRKPHPLPPAAVAARASAYDEQAKALRQLQSARSLASSLADIRRKNHFAESISIAFRKAQHD